MEVRRCGVHGLVLGDDNKCVICRRGDVELVPRTSSDWPIVVFVCFIGALAISTLGYWLWKQSQKPAPVAPVVAAESPPPASSVVEEEIATAPRPSRVDRPPGEVEPPPVPETPELTTEQIEAKKRRVPVKMYMTPRCSLCNSARTFLKSRGYALTELDIEASPTDRVLLQSINPDASVPTFDVGGRVLIGYDAVLLDDAIEAKALPKK